MLLLILRNPNIILHLYMRISCFVFVFHSGGAHAHLSRRGERLRAPPERRDDALGQPHHGHHGSVGAGHGAADPRPSPPQALQAQLLAHQPHYVASHHGPSNLPACAAHVSAAAYAGGAGGGENCVFCFCFEGLLLEEGEGGGGGGHRRPF